MTVQFSHFPGHSETDRSVLIMPTTYVEVFQNAELVLAFFCFKQNMRFNFKPLN